jgi:hypothetical protein
MINEFIFLMKLAVHCINKKEFNFDKNSLLQYYPSGFLVYSIWSFWFLHYFATW